MPRFLVPTFAFFIFCIFNLSTTSAQNVRAVASVDGLKPCSTETVNGNCYLNIDRRFPVTLPTIQMQKGAQIMVNVYHIYPFENLTLDAGTLQAFESTDQASGLLTALTPMLKAPTFSIAQTANEDMQSAADFKAIVGGVSSFAAIDCTVPQSNPEVQVRCDLSNLNDLLTTTMKPIHDYFSTASDIYAAAREIQFAAPQPVNAIAPTTLRGPGVPETKLPDPWVKYDEWRTQMLKDLSTLGTATSNLLAELPGACQKKTDPKPSGPWVAPPRRCKHTGDTTAPPTVPLAVPATYDAVRTQLDADYQTFLNAGPTAATKQEVDDLKTQLDARHNRIVALLPNYTFVLPTTITKITTDMQTLEANITLVPDTKVRETFVGIIRDPVSTDKADRPLAPFHLLGRQVTYTLNEQNQIANSLLQLPAATQKQAVLTITVLFADPKFEVSTGAFFSWMPNRSFANSTQISIVNGVPTQGNVFINETTSSSPEIIPFAAANYRLGPDFHLRALGNRRSAVYATLAVALNPYNTTVEYAAGFSFSWRFLMLSPLFHIGENTHLTQGEAPNQVWCTNGAAAGSTPPPCVGAPPAPSTTTFWRGAAAFGIGIRIPTTFSATNH